MAGDWIKIDHSTPDKPEVVRMADELGIDQDAIMGKLIRIWVWADQNSIDGNANGTPAAFLDRLAQQPGFATAMKKVGWLTENGFPNFDRHNGSSAKSRALSNRRKAEYRSKGNAPVHADVPRSGTLPASPRRGPEKRERIREKKEEVPLPLDDAPVRGSKSRAGTPDEVETYAREIGAAPGQGEVFFWKMEGCGWTNGKKPVKDWRATVKAWHISGYLAIPVNGTASPKPAPPPANAPEGTPGHGDEPRAKPCDPAFHRLRDAIRNPGKETDEIEYITDDRDRE